MQMPLPVYAMQEMLLCGDCIRRFTRQKHIFHDYYQIFLPNDLVIVVVVVVDGVVVFAASVLQTKLRSNGSENDSGSFFHRG